VNQPFWCRKVLEIHLNISMLTFQFIKKPDMAFSSEGFFWLQKFCIAQDPYQGFFQRANPDPEPDQHQNCLEP
jgi:hypothetical protein